MKFEFSSNPLEKISSDVALVFAFAGGKKQKSYIPLESFTKIDTLLDRQLAKVALLENFTAKKGEMIKIIPQRVIAPSQIVVLGLGEKKDFSLTNFREVIGSFAKSMHLKIDSASVSLPHTKESGIEISESLHAFVEGAQLGTYVFLKYKKEETKERKFANVIIAGQEETKSLKDITQKAQLYSQATILARDLVNETPTIATPTYLAKLAQDIAKSSTQITCTIYSKEEAEKMGMEAFLGIARASDTPPKFIHLEYTPKRASKEKIAIVGKGITFDSGGINVKPGEHMNDMKMDMAGAAAVLGVFSVIDAIAPETTVIGLIAATSNMISGASIVPGDIVRAMNGKTIEIGNTDAEGRVTLADSLSYALKQGATQIIDLATLTGACMVALGHDISGLFSNDKALAEKVVTAATAEGEKMWEMPLDKDYKELNKSEVADISNIGQDRYGGAITAALFLEEFVDGKPWVHLDIAGPAFSAKGNKLSPAGGTGFGVRSMLKLLDTFQ